jgi:copper(I)-binding protein
MLGRLLLASLICVSAHSSAHEHVPAATPIHVQTPWARALPPNAPAGAVYFKLHSASAQADRLIAASTPIADHAELHTSALVGDVMKMQPLQSVEIPAQGQVEFAPGGKHVMLFGLKQPLQAGQHFPLTLEFEHAGTQQVEVSIQAEAPGAQHQHH